MRPTNISKLMRAETKFDRKERHQQVLWELLNNKNEEMKRKLLDLIDYIHSTEQQQIENEMEQVQGEMKKWQRSEYEPVNFDVVIVNKISQIEKEK